MDTDLQAIKDAIDLVYYRNKQGLVSGEIGNAVFTALLNAIQDSRDENVSNFDVVTKAGHGFVKGDVLYYNGFDWAKAKANVVGSLGYFMVSAVDGNDFTIQNIGLISGLGGLVAGSMYYVSQATAGAITATKPATGYANPIFYAIGETKGFVMPFLADIDFANINLKTDPIIAKRLLLSQGSDIASANNLSLNGASNGNTYSITGTTQINLIDSSQWQNGAEISLKFDDVLTIKHNQESSGDNKKINLAGAADYETTAGDVLTFRLIDGEWFETKSSGAGSGGGGHTIQEEGSPLTQRTNLNFLGNVTVADNEGDDSTDVTINVDASNAGGKLYIFYNY